MTIRPILIVSVLLISGQGKAASLSSLVASADAIFVGTESSPVQAGNTATFYLNVERVFTGTISPGATINVTWSKPYEGLPDGPSAIRGIWFLKKAASGGWECLPAGSQGNATFFPDLSLPASEGALPAALAYDPAAMPLADQIILESAGGKPHANSRLLLAVVSQPLSPGALQAFRYLASSTVNDQMLIGVTGLIEASDTGGLLAAERLAAGLTTGTPGADLVASAIQHQFRSVDPAAVSALGRMAASTTAAPAMQNAAAQALVAIHSAAALPALTLLLNGSTPANQIYGAQGLSYFVNGVGIPTPGEMASLDHLNNRQPSPYRTPDTDQHVGYASGEQQSFIRYWQAWLAAHPELLGSPAPQ